MNRDERFERRGGLNLKHVYKRIGAWERLVRTTRCTSHFSSSTKQLAPTSCSVRDAFSPVLSHRARAGVNCQLCMIDDRKGPRFQASRHFLAFRLEVAFTVSRSARRLSVVHSAERDDEESIDGRVLRCFERQTFAAHTLFVAVFEKFVAAELDPFAPRAEAGLGKLLPVR